MQQISDEICANFFTTGRNEEEAEHEHQIAHFRRTTRGADELDWALTEMALTLRDANAVEDAIEGWVSTETTAHAIEVATDEVRSELSTKRLCQPETVVEVGASAAVSGAAVDNGDDASVDTDSDAEPVLEVHEPTSNEIDDLATRMLALAVDLGKLGLPYVGPHVHLTDAVSNLGCVYRRTAPTVARGRDSDMRIFFNAIPKSKSKKD